MTLELSFWFYLLAGAIYDRVKRRTVTCHPPFPLWYLASSLRHWSTGAHMPGGRTVDCKVVDTVGLKAILVRHVFG